MHISTIIRERRQALGLTQEAVAQALGVSAPAVSKWESGTSIPDVGLLSPLARLLGTDLNGLLGFQQELGRQGVADFLAALAQEQELAGAVALARGKLREFPNDCLLALNIALYLEGMAAIRGEKDPERESWVRTLYHQAAAGRDQGVANQARAMLFSQSLEEKDFVQAETILSQLPEETMYSKAHMRASLLTAQEKWSEAAQVAETSLLQEAGSLQSLLLALMDLAVKEGRARDIPALTQKAQAITEALDLGPYHRHTIAFQSACLRREGPEALEAFRGLVEAVQAPILRTGSPLYRHLADKERGPFGPEFRQTLLREIQNPEEPAYAFLRETPGFQELLAELEHAEP